MLGPGAELGRDQVCRPQAQAGVDVIARDDEIATVICDAAHHGMHMVPMGDADPVKPRLFLQRRRLLPVRRIIGIDRAVLTPQRLASARCCPPSPLPRLPMCRRSVAPTPPSAACAPSGHRRACTPPLRFGVRQRSPGEPIGECRDLIYPVAERRSEAVRNHLAPALRGINP
jgi:hypothetical protein